LKERKESIFFREKKKRKEKGGNAQGKKREMGTWEGGGEVPYSTIEKGKKKDKSLEIRKKEERESRKRRGLNAPLVFEKEREGKKIFNLRRRKRERGGKGGSQGKDGGETHKLPQPTREKRKKKGKNPFSSLPGRKKKKRGRHLRGKENEGKKLYNFYHF